MAKPWNRIGAWAAEAERVEAEEKELAPASAASVLEFPTLAESVASKPKKKKKPQTLSFSEFTMGVSVGPGTRLRSIADVCGLTTQKKMLLPTDPRDRPGEEDYRGGGLGGAFRDSGGGAERFDRERVRGFGAGFEHERESGVSLRDRERNEPSRADGDSYWRATKKPLSSFGVYKDERRGSRIVDRQLPSPADEVGKWRSSKKPSPLAYDRGSGRYEGRRETFDESRPSRADEVDNWGTSKRPLPAASGWRPATGYDSSYREAGADSERWSKRQQPREEPQRRRLVLTPRTRPLSMFPPPGPQGDTEVPSPVQPASPAGISDSLPPPRSKPKLNPFGSARPREEVLAEKGQDWRRIGNEYEVKERDSRPSSSHSSRVDTVEVSAEVAIKPKLKVNPFGEAKPREVLLEERGKDWRKADFELEHCGTDRFSLSSSAIMISA